MVIICSNRVTSIQKFQPHLWTEHSIVVELNFKHFSGPIHVIAFYNKPQIRAQLESELKHTVKMIRTKQNSASILIAGDFNRKIDTMKKLVKDLNLPIMKD